VTQSRLTLPDRTAFERDGFARLSGPAIADLKVALTAPMLDLAKRAAERLLPAELVAAAPTDASLADYIAFLNSVEQDNAVTRALYETLPTLPGVIATIDHPALRAAATWAGIDHAQAGTLPLVRLDRPGETRFATPAHQDSWYSMLSPNAVTLWLPLCEMTDEIGLLHVIPGSHKAGLAPFKPHETGHEWFETAKSIPDSDFQPVAMTDDDVLIFNQSLIHKSGANRSDQVRISVQFRYNDLATAERLTSTYTPSLSRHVLDKQADHLNARRQNRSPAA
tara:strand:+ start:2749 stop:3588 length:840 start_codon:yes stop_codon:yes gene_type:complete